MYKNKISFDWTSPVFNKGFFLDETTHTWWNDGLLLLWFNLKHDSLTAVKFQFSETKND